MLKKYVVYAHRRKDNEEIFYIGCCTRHDRRGHKGKSRFSRAFDFKRHTIPWLEVYTAAGGADVEFLFSSDNRDEAFEKEREWVEKIGREIDGGTLTNVCFGGCGAPGQPNSEETKRKKAESKLGKLNPMYGKTGSDHPQSRKVIDIETNFIFQSIGEAAERNDYKMKTLYNWLTGHRRNPTNLRFAS